MPASDPSAFLRATPPFDALPRPLFDEAAAELAVASWPAGTQLARAGGAPLQDLYVVRAGSVRLERDGQTIQVLEEGEAFGYTSLFTGTAMLDVIAEEGLVTCRLPGAAFRRLLADAAFARHFAAGLGARLRSSLEHAPAAAFAPDLTEDVLSLVTGPAVWVEPDASVVDAARVMRERRISSVLVRSDPPGIVTDRDFRNRVLAEGLGPATPVGRVVSRPLQTVAAGTPVHEAWTALLDAGVHHLPVARDGEILGVVTSTDLARASAQGPVALVRRVERLPSRDALAGHAAVVARMAASLVSAGLDAALVASFVSRLNDALVRRILQLAERDLGPPPAPYAWLAVGSEGRMEQTLLTDQDNALVFADEGEASRPWFAALADRVNADLEAAGAPPCPGGIMARTWHATVSEWRERFAGWIDSPTPQAVLQAATFFDFRRAAGTLAVEPLDEVLARAVERPIFLRFLAKAALDFRAPAALLLRLRGASSPLDLKRHGIAPVVFLARCYGLEAGTRARSTPDRLDAAARAGLLGESTAEEARDAYRFLLGLRLRRQLRALADGRPAGDGVALAELSPLERTRLKDALRAVKSLQEAAERHFRTQF